MKKKIFITLCLMATSLAMPAIAQNSELDAFIKRHSNDGDASYVEMAKPMLDAAFAHAQYKVKNVAYPKSFKSLVMFDYYPSLKHSLGKYEVLMSSRSKNGVEYTCYYLPSGDGAKEIVIVQVKKVPVIQVKTAGDTLNKKEQDQVSITHMVSDGNMDLNQINNYLSVIRHKLSSLGVDASAIGRASAGNFGTMYHFDNDRIHVYYDKIREQMEEIKNKRLYSPDFNWQIRAESGKNNLYIDGQKIETDFPEIVIPEIDLSGITIRKDTSKTNTDLE